MTQHAFNCKMFPMGALKPEEEQADENQRVKLKKML